MHGAGYLHGRTDERQHQPLERILKLNNQTGSSWWNPAETRTWDIGMRSGAGQDKLRRTVCRRLFLYTRVKKLKFVQLITRKPS